MGFFSLIVLRQMVDLEDGGRIALDWFSNADFTDATPILLILPGLTGEYVTEI